MKKKIQIIAYLLVFTSEYRKVMNIPGAWRRVNCAWRCVVFIVQRIMEDFDVSTHA